MRSGSAKLDKKNDPSDWISSIMEFVGQLECHFIDLACDLEISNGFFKSRRVCIKKGSFQKAFGSEEKCYEVTLHNRFHCTARNDGLITVCDESKQQPDM